MTILTVPKELAKKGDLVLVPKSEYEEFLRIRKLFAEPTAAEKMAIARGRQEIRRGKFSSWDQTRNELASISR